MLWCNNPNTKLLSFSRNFKKFDTKSHCTFEAAISCHQYISHDFRANYKVGSAKVAVSCRLL